MLERVTRVHLVGIGGIGMSGIAELLIHLGYEVSGSDLRSSVITKRLQTLGAQVDVGHDSRHVGEVDLVVLSSAVPQDNPERREAERRGIPLIARGVMLAELSCQRRGIAVVGSHGKTTTAAMIATVLEYGGLDPTALIGGTLSAFGSNARLGQGQFMVVEADESDRSFLELSPEIAVLTNLDEEHLDAYDGIGEFEDAFVTFAGSVPVEGCVVACLDDPWLRRLLPRVKRPVVTYGIDADAADVQASEVTLGPAGSRCRVRMSSLGGEVGEFECTLAVPGRHNLQNAMAAVTVGARLGLPIDVIADALTRFTGADRRFQVVAVVDGITVIDDYAHHPTEIAAVLATIRLRTPRRVIAVFQAHRYTRTQQLLERFGEVLAGVDVLILTEVYAASELPIAGVTASALAAAVRHVASVSVRVVSELDCVASVVATEAQPGDVVVTLGAGSINSVVPQIVEALRRQQGAEISR